MGAKVIKNYELRITNDEVVARRAIKYSDELRITNDKVVARRAIKRGCPKSFILRGRLQHIPSYHWLSYTTYSKSG